MANYRSRVLKLDTKAFKKLADGIAEIDGKPILAMFDKQSFEFGDARGAERVVTISQAMADEAEITPSTASVIIWLGEEYRLLTPPIYTDGLIKLVLQ